MGNLSDEGFVRVLSSENAMPDIGVVSPGIRAGHKGVAPAAQEATNHVESALGPAVPLEVKTIA